MPDFDVEKLRGQLEGEVRSDLFSCIQYSVDASIFQIQPQAVVLPKSITDIEAAVAFAREEELPIIPRGAATGITGGCLGRGLVVDLARHLNQILSLDPDAGTAVVQPGVVQDQLNAAAAAHGLRFGPDTSTGNRATLGGMLGNNSSGAHSRRYGKTIDNLIAAKVLLADGSKLTFQDQSADVLRGGTASDARARIYQTLDRIRQDLRDEINQRFPKIQRRVSGYSLDEFLGSDINLSKLVCGSEGTLGLATEMTVKLSPNPGATGICIIHFHDLIEGLRHVPFILAHDPFAVELIDDHILAMGRKSPLMHNQIGWLDGEPEGILVVEFDGESEAAVKGKLDALQAACQRESIGYSHVQLQDQIEVNKVWALRKAGLGLLMSKRSDEKAIAFLEDSAVPPERVADFMAELREYTGKVGKEAGFYGHAGVGLIHLRPMLNLRKQADLDLLVKMMQDAADMLLGYGGSLSGEHGDGLIRSWLIEKMYGEKICNAFRQIKDAFDPDGLMNPGKIVDPPPPTENLRVDPRTKDHEIDAFFHYDGGLPMAAGMCNGNAACRKPDGLMCPSFQASNDELHSTRARATCMQAVLYGRCDESELTGDGMYRVMEYCLQCKGCKIDCPSLVDVAKMKSEFLYHYQKKHGISLRNRIFGNIDRISRLASPFAGLTNFIMNTGLNKGLLESIVGITSKRKAPPYASERFSHWLKRRGGPKPGTGDKIALFVDTFSEFNYPEIAQAAIRLLEALNCDIRVAPYTCCGRPAISKGLLDGARNRARKVLDRYTPLIDAGYRVLGLEPSCLLTFRDEYPSMFPGPEAAKLAGAALTFDEYLNDRLQAGRLNLDWRKQTAQVLLHGHCHQKAQVGTNPTLNVLRSVPGFTVTEIPSGCCGMAGTFGYEAEHYEFSLRVGELQLFPAIRSSPENTIIVASGLSCRTQIEHGTQRDGKHLVEVLAEQLSTDDPVDGGHA